MEKKMDEKQKREYQTVVLAALLHDIGKLLHRGSVEYKGKHEYASAAFIKNSRDKLENNKLYDIDLVMLLVQQHHATKTATWENEYFVAKTDVEKEKLWKLIRIVQEADSYSCAERDLEQQRKRDVAREMVPMDSIFSNVNLDLKNTGDEKTGRYHLHPFEPLTAFPENFQKLHPNENNNLIDLFKNNIPFFSSLERFDEVLNIWLNILEIFMWAVPSDTRYEISDISLFDHLRSSAAIAACMYKRHIGSIEEGKNFDWKEEFVFVGGDFSGIQNYIFDITSLGSGGAAKRLRARSFFIFLFSEVTIHKILHALDLPIVCDLFSSGGKFLLLAPNEKETSNILKQIKTEIEQEIHDTYFNQFSFLLTNATVKEFKKEFEVYNFFKIADKMFYRLEVEKIKESQQVLLDAHTKTWNVNAFKADKMYEVYQEFGVCKICGRHPATRYEIQDKEEDTPIECCFTCFRDKYFIGQSLPKCSYIAFGKGTVSENDEQVGKKIVIFHPYRNNDNKNDESYYVELLEGLEDCKKSNEYYLMYDIGEKKDKNGTNRLVSGKKYYANYVPYDTAKKDTERVLSFEDIAKKSIWQKNDLKGNGKFYGSDLLGILKADVDNLGLVFSKGFENPKRNEKDLKEIDKKTISRYLTMSRMLELFFSGWINKTISGSDKEAIINELVKIEHVDRDPFRRYIEKDVINFKNIYTVYSGGDDMVLVGPWETMIVFSIFLNWQFRKYTCNNPFITLSAGLTFIKPNFPIASAIKQADLLLTKSKGGTIHEESGDTKQGQDKTPSEEKDNGKDRITLFGTTVTWNKLPELINFFLFLNEKLNNNNEEKSNINISFLYRLLEYHRMALKFLDRDDVKGLKYLSALSYDVGRNIVKRNKDGSIVKGYENEQKVLQTLINEKPDKNSLIYNIKVPLFWALYKNRRARKDEDISNI